MSDDSARPPAEEGGLEDLGLPAEPGRRRRRRGPFGCLIGLLLVALLVGGTYVALTRGVAWVESRFTEAEDYSGPGEGRVTVEVSEGDTATDIGRTLEEQDVVASVEAFTGAANARPDEAARIQVGFYELRRRMSASDALDVLVDPENLLQSAVTIPEGLRVVDIVDRLAKNTDFAKRRFERVLDRPDQLGLPRYAKGNPEGYLFPATYSFRPDDTPRTMLRQMVDRWRQAAEEANLEQRAQELGYTPGEVMTVASLVEAEGRGDDMPKVARVIYNRLENPGTAGTTGRLEIDATVNYAHGRNLGVALSPEDLEIDSPYNTRRYPGLPPTPIESPGDEAIAAAANPAEGDWYYYVTVNLRTGETKFAETYDEFLEYKREYQAYCEDSDAC